MVAEALEGVKPANPLAERKTGPEYDFQSVASGTAWNYGAKHRATPARALALCGQMNHLLIAISAGLGVCVVLLLVLLATLVRRTGRLADERREQDEQEHDAHAE